MNKHTATVNGKTFKRSSLNRTYTHMVTGDESPTAPSFYSEAEKKAYKPRKDLDLGWNGSLVLAEKNAATMRSRGFVNVRILPAKVTQTKPSGKPARSAEEVAAARDAARLFNNLWELIWRAESYRMMKAADFVALVEQMEKKGYYLVTKGRAFDAIEQVRVDDTDQDGGRVLWDRGEARGTFLVRRWTTFVEFVSAKELNARMDRAVAAGKADALVKIDDVVKVQEVR